MEIKGKVIEILPKQTGEGKNGTWVKNSFVIETHEEYSRKIAILTFKEININKGDDVAASVNIESREYNGRWYTNVMAWRVEVTAAATTAAATTAAHTKPDIDDGSDEDLPF